MFTDRNHNENPKAYLNDVITITNMSYYEKASFLELVLWLTHHWILYHPEAKINKLREVDK